MIEYRAFLHQSLSSPHRELVVIGETAERPDHRSVLVGLTWKDIPDHGFDQPPRLFEFGRDQDRFIRAIFNACWDAGMRPDGFDDTRESMKATNAHLQDMRAIAFGKLQIPSPEANQRRSTL